MIEVHIYRTDDEHQEALAIVRIERLDAYDVPEAGDYSVRFAVERVGAVGLHQRQIIGFPRLKYNVLALVKQALETLEPSELELEDGVSPPDMARRQHRPLSALQAWASSLRHHGPALRSGQPEQHGGD